MAIPTVKIVFIGGVKSGKSALAEKKILELSSDAEQNIKPVYLATNEVYDNEMVKRIMKHKEQRQDRFTTIEEPLNLFQTIKDIESPILIECVGMWINNMLYYKRSDDDIKKELNQILSLNKTLVLVHNEVGLGLLSDNPLGRKFVDLSGEVSQILGQHCDEVYFCLGGLSLRMK